MEQIAQTLWPGLDTEALGSPREESRGLPHRQNKCKTQNCVVLKFQFCSYPQELKAKSIREVGLPMQTAALSTLNRLEVVPG